MPDMHICQCAIS